MGSARLLDDGERAAAPAASRAAAFDLARRLPSIVASARALSSQLAHGVHGRRRAGVGEDFWQFRPHAAGESAASVDWRRSARADRLFVREREWQAAQDVALWIDRSRSMDFASSPALHAKVSRALVIGLALADLLVRGGERVSLLGLTKPVAARDVIERFAAALATGRGGDAAAEIPLSAPGARRSQFVLIGDFLSDASAIAASIARLAAAGAGGHLLMIADPAEETFPYRGHVEFADVDGAHRLRVGMAEGLREAYADALAAHREALRDACRRLGWSFAIHRTDRPPAEALLALRMRLEAPR